MLATAEDLGLSSVREHCHEKKLLKVHEIVYEVDSDNYSVGNVLLTYADVMPA